MNSIKILYTSYVPWNIRFSFHIPRFLGIALFGDKRPLQGLRIKDYSRFGHLRSATHGTPLCLVGTQSKVQRNFQNVE
jgi:hypothetical protein